MASFSLAQLLGLYLLIVGAIVVYRKRSIMPAANQLVANRPLLLVMGCVELIAGLAIVLTNPSVTPDANGLVSLIGWMIIVEGILYLSLPRKQVMKFTKSFNTPQWYSVGGVLAFLAGAYLSASGFGLI